MCRSDQRALEIRLGERLPDLLEIWRLSAQPVQRRFGVGHCGGDGLVHFMGDRGGELSDRCDAVRMLELHLLLAVAPLALACFAFCPLALGQVEHESHILVATFLEGRSANQRGTRLPSLRKYSFSNGCTLPAFSISGTRHRTSGSRHSGGVSSFQSKRPESRSSRSYPTIRRKASLASRI